MTARLAFIALVAAGATIHAQVPSLPGVLARAAEYHAAYVKAVSGVSLEEQMQIREVTGDETRSTVRLSADVVLVNVNQRVDARDGAGGRRKVEVRSQFSKPTFAAIDLTKLR